MSLQTAAIADVLDRLPAAPVRVEVDALSREWFGVWLAVNGGDPHAEWDLLQRVRLPSGYAHAMIGDSVVAVGRAVVDTGWAGVFGMATLPEARGHGAGRSVLAALARWAYADHMYLQAESSNTAALMLYRQAGFTEVCEYHYRTA